MSWETAAAGLPALTFELFGLDRCWRPGSGANTRAKGGVTCAGSVGQLWVCRRVLWHSFFQTGSAASSAGAAKGKVREWQGEGRMLGGSLQIQIVMQSVLRLEWLFIGFFKGFHSFLGDLVVASMLVAGKVPSTAGATQPEGQDQAPSCVD